MHYHHVYAWIWMVIPIAAIFARFAKRWFSLKERELELRMQRSADQAVLSAAETERLKRRVAVLERILTDRSATLADEIDRLRDAPVH